MSQSLAKIYVHLVFSTKRRARILDATDNYLGGIFRDLDSPSIEINSEPDHIHALFALSRTQSISEVTAQVKRGSSTWLKTRGPRYSDFHWQNGYGAFSVSQSSVDDVRHYIRNQGEHHRRMSFQDEFRALLKRYEVEFDEQYVWD